MELVKLSPLFSKIKHTLMLLQTQIQL